MSNGHRNNNANNSNDMDIDKYDDKTAFWETVNRSGLLKSSNLNAFFTQRYDEQTSNINILTRDSRVENLLDPCHLYLLPLEKESRAITSTIIPSPYLQSCCIVQTYWNTFGQEFTIAGTESGLVMLIEQGRVKNSVALAAKPIKM